MVVRLWDGFIRGFHWLLVALLGGLWFTGGKVDYVDQHEMLGLTLLALLLTRILWGIFGSEPARFTTFIKSPQAALHHFTRGDRYPPLTHNAAGAYMVVLMLVLLLLQALTGLFTDDAIFYRGPLASMVDSDTRSLLTSIHKTNFDFILIAAGLHIVAVFAYLFVRRQNLITPMITGQKQIQAEQQPPRQRHGGWGFILLAINLGWIFWWLG